MRPLISKTVLGLVVIALTVATSLLVQLSQPTADAGLPSRTLIGAAMGTHSNESFPRAVDRGDRLFGSLDAVRVYSNGTPRPWSQIRAALGRSSAVVSFKEKPEVILSGRHDAFYRQWFATSPRDQLKYLTYFHEPEDNNCHGKLSA